jgi:hypothetical protein
LAGFLGGKLYEAGTRFLDGEVSGIQSETSKVI